MKVRKITAFIMAGLMTVLSAAGCSRTEQTGSLPETESVVETEVPVTDIDDREALLIGAEGSGGIFNPLFAESETDRKVCSLIFDTICSVDELGKLEDAAGHFEKIDSAADGIDDPEDVYGGENSGTGEGEDADETVTYQLTLKEGLKFSDGSDLTIDDVIFTWKLMADPYYTGRYSLAEVPVVGMQEYYYDTKDVAAYKKNLKKTYSDKKISEEDFIAYLIDTKLDGWFDGELPGDLDGNGTTWVEYLQSNGYDTAGVEEDSDALLELLAKCEYEHYSFSYDPYTYYQEKAHADILSGGVEVADIEGIKKVDDHTCTVDFESAPDAAALRAMTVIPVLSEIYYGAGYEKGGIEALKQMNGSPVGSGAYILYTYAEDSVSLEASENSRLKTQAQYVKIKNTAEEEKAKALKDGTIAFASMSMSDPVEDSDQLQFTPVQGSGFYYLGINTDIVNRAGVRAGIMSLVDKSLLDASEEEISQILEDAGSSIIETVSDRIKLISQTWPMTHLSFCYPGIESLSEDGEEADLYEYSREAAETEFASEGYQNNGSELVRSGEQLKLNMGISEELPDCIKAIAWKLKSDLEEMGAQITLKEYTQGEMEATIPTAAFDLWIGELTDLTDYDMEDYLKYGGEKNYFHHQNGYADLLFEEIRETDDDSYRKDTVREMLQDVMAGDYCRPLCEEVSQVYVSNTSMISWEGKDTDTVNMYDSFAEIVCAIGLK
ncbi:MAG: ABC transporter substrate-binding protein [Lachnospiraceae bacterium]|nr:ABC transporter substrate-binding protein [Lachnospiraceae bacterium]